MMLSTALRIIEQNTNSLWSRLYNNLVPPAIAMKTQNKIPRFYKNFPNLIIKEAKEFYYENIKIKSSSIIYFHSKYKVFLCFRELVQHFFDVGSGIVADALRLCDEWLVT